MSAHVAAIVTMIARQVAIVLVIGGLAVAAALARRPLKRRRSTRTTEPGVRLARCHRCGSALPTGAQFCHSCGARAT